MLIYSGVITVCNSGCGCCAFATMITFLVIYIIEMIFAISFGEGAEAIDAADTDGSSTAAEWGEIADFMTIMYAVEVVVTLATVITWYYMRLYEKWFNRQQNHCFLIMALFAVWFLVAVIVTVAFESENDVGLTFGTVLGLIILFTICGPFCVLCCL